MRRLAVLDLPGDEAVLAREFQDALTQLDRQTVQQRIDELLQRQTESGLSNAEKLELRELLAQRTRERAG